MARRFGVSDLVVELLFKSVGTSLPKFASSVSATLAGISGLVIGNVVGSKIANMRLTLGLAATLEPLEIAELHVVDTVPIMLFFSLALLCFVRSDWRISRARGAIAIVAYAAFMVAAFMQGWG